MQHVGGGVGELLRRQIDRAPIGRLLLFRQIDVQQFLAKVLEPVPVGERPGKPGGDLGAADRCGGNAELTLQHGHVEAGEVHQLDDAGIPEQAA